MRRWLAVVALVSLSALGLRADVPVWYSFTSPDGDTQAVVWLSGLASGPDGSLLVTSGTLTVDASSNPLLPLETYSLIFIGSSANWTSTKAFVVDDLLYPGDDAASGPNHGDMSGGDPSYLTWWGLLFGDGGTTEINIWGNGGADNYSLVMGLPDRVYPLTENGITGTFAPIPSDPPLPFPEPGTILLLSVMATLGLGLPGILRRRPR
jgi:hypothetical protein